MLALLVVSHVLVLAELEVVRGGGVRQLDPPLQLPAPVLRLASLEYHNLVADLLFSRTLSFYGGKRHRGETIDEATYRTIYQRLSAASDLDPYFVDPYYFGEAVLAWEAHLPREANALLDRGRISRPDDWVMPFFMGFNAFYFLQDNALASKYLMEAARRPGSAPLIGLLATRVASKSGSAEVAVAFLDEFAARTSDRATRDKIQRRAHALQGIVILEQAMRRYRQAFGVGPSDLGALVERGVLSALPVDPYGGEYYITPEGNIWTTSDLRPVTDK
ncbi:MAG: hypothetical protein ACOYXR_14430 [Nitrospirota bacterium]